MPDELVEQKPLADIATWGGRNDSKLVLSDAAVKKVARKSLSPSTAEAMNGCTARWAIEKILPRTDDPFGAAELGTAGHRVFEQVFSLPSEQRTTQVAMEFVSNLQNDLDGKVAIPRDPVDFDRWHSSVTRLVTGLWLIENPREIEIVGNEVEIKDIKVGGVPILLYIDRLGYKTINGERVLTVSDYKTGKVPNLRWGDKHGEQLRIYTLALDASPDHERPEAAEVLYTQFEELRVVDLSDEAMNTTLEKFQKAWATHNKLVETHEFTTKTSALCGWCPAVNVCPAAKAEGKVPKVEFDIAGEALGIGETSVAVSLATKPGQVSEARGTESEKPNEQKVTKHMSEDKPWEETQNDGTLNPNSYAATAVFGLVSLAVEVLHAHDQDVTAKNVRALSQTFDEIITEVFADFGRSNASFQDGLHTRLRGALRTSIETLPAPFGEGLDAWETWVGQATRRTRAIAKTAIALWERADKVENPWAALAVEEKKEVDDFADID